jgi:hypothetical protein
MDTFNLLECVVMGCTGKRRIEATDGGAQTFRQQDLLIAAALGIIAVRGDIWAVQVLPALLFKQLNGKLFYGVFVQSAHSVFSPALCGIVERSKLSQQDSRLLAERKALFVASTVAASSFFKEKKVDGFMVRQAFRENAQSEATAER